MKIYEHINNNLKTDKITKDYIWSINKQTSDNVHNIINNYEDVKNSFDNYAKDYDEDKETSDMFDAENEVVINLLDVKENDNILDLGCGTGKYIKLYGKNKLVKITGIDLSNESLKIAKEKNKGIKVEYIEGNIININKPDNVFNKINSSQVLKFLKSQDELNKLFKEVNRLLKVGGYFVFSNNYPNGDNDEIKIDGNMKKHSIANYKEAAQQSGLKIDEFEFIKDKKGNDYLFVMKLIKPI